MMFLPCVLFGLAADVQMIVSTFQYRPIAMSKMPNKCIRPLMLGIAFLSLILSLVAFFFCFLVFGGINADEHIRQTMYVLFLIKAISWSPFLGMELYDTVFEQVYHDVQF